MAKDGVRARSTRKGVALPRLPSHPQVGKLTLPFAKGDSMGPDVLPVQGGLGEFWGCSSVFPILSYFLWELRGMGRAAVVWEEEPQTWNLKT